MGKVGCDIWEKWVGGRRNEDLDDRAVAALLETRHLDPHNGLFEGHERRLHVVLLAAEEVRPDLGVETLDLRRVGERAELGLEGVERGEEVGVEEREERPHLSKTQE